MATKSSGGKIKIGFIPLTDCASVVMAHELGLYKKHGVDVEVSREASWATIRDKVLSGDLRRRALPVRHAVFGLHRRRRDRGAGDAHRDDRSTTTGRRSRSRKISAARSASAKSAKSKPRSRR